MKEYNNIKELYEALVPAMNVKIRELKHYGIQNIDKEDIWNYLKEKKWTTAINLCISEMVSDIIHLNNIEIDNYVKNKGDNLEK